MINIYQFPILVGRADQQKNEVRALFFNVDTFKTCLKAILSVGLAYAVLTLGTTLYALGGSFSLMFFVIQQRLNVNCLSWMVRASLVALCLAASSLLSLEVAPVKSSLDSHALDQYIILVTNISDDEESADNQFKAIQDFMKTEEIQDKTKQTIHKKYHYDKDLIKGRKGAGIEPNDVNLVTATGNKHGSAEVPYLNANFVEAPSFSSSRHIAVQAPTEHTVKHFFNAMIEHDSHVIAAMVMPEEYSQSQKKNADRCFPYWDQEEIDLGNDFKVVKGETIDTVKVDGGENEYIIIRELKITKDGELFRTIYQYHYQNWPDHGAPNPQVFAKFNELVNGKMETLADQGLSGPITAHCHAGSGRTGIFLAARFFQEYVEKMLQIVNSLEKIECNVPKLLAEMKLCRRLIDGKTSVQYRAVLTWAKNYIASLSKN